MPFSIDIGFPKSKPWPTAAQWELAKWPTSWRWALGVGPEAKIIEDAGEFEEGKHPRAQSGEHGGEFVKKGAEGGAQSAPSEEASKPTSREKPAHIANLRVPPAWTDVKYNDDPKASLWVTGKDAKGRLQYIYNPEFAAQQSAIKFSRIAELDNKFLEIYRQNEANRRSDNPRTKALADCVHLIAEMGIRPGSETDTKSEKQAYGATTLLGKHLVREGNDVFLQFTGKKGVDLKLPVNSSITRRMLAERAVNAGDDGKLFPEINEKALLDYVHSFDGGGFKTKDFRTRLGTETAQTEVAKRPAPKDEKEYKKAVTEVAKVVAAKLGNTPAIALQSYISPMAFAGWRQNLESQHATP